MWADAGEAGIGGRRREKFVSQSRNSRLAQSGQYVTGFGGLSDVK
jgi:hypothetical protein